MKLSLDCQAQNKSENPQAAPLLFSKISDSLSGWKIACLCLVEPQFNQAFNDITPLRTLYDDRGWGRHFELK
jgi:hypothetical protein